MRKLRVCVIDLVSRGPCSLFMRVMAPNLASIMPQVVAVWCSQEGMRSPSSLHRRREPDRRRCLPTPTWSFIGAFTEAAQTAYALEPLLPCPRSRSLPSAVPHARCYPQDALHYFDYVLGFTDRAVLRERSRGLRSTSAPRSAPLGRPATDRPAGGARPLAVQRAILRKAPLLKIVPMLGSLGCPYTCSFCIDAAVPYQPLDSREIREDLRFLLRQVPTAGGGLARSQLRRPLRRHLDAIEEAVPPGSIDSIAESSLSLLSEPHLEAASAKMASRPSCPASSRGSSWATSRRPAPARAWTKSSAVAEHVNMILRYIPYIQTNFVLGLDSDEGDGAVRADQAFPGPCPRSVSRLLAC